MGHVVIVGAGPAGACLAHLLASRGMRVTLLERQRDFAREFRGEVLMPSGVDALGQMGLRSILDASGTVVAEGFEVYHGARRLLAIRFGEWWPEAARPRTFSQAAFLEAVVDDAARFPGFHLERGCTVRDVLTEGGRVVGVEADTASGSHAFRADYVIGADGRASVLRKRANLDEERHPQAFDIVWCRVPLPGFMRSPVLLRGYVGTGHTAILIPSHDGRLQIAWAIEKGTFGDLRRQGIEAWIEEMAAHVSPDVGAHLRAHRGDVTAPFLLDVVCDRLVRWRAPGLLLVGDAAHPMSPVGGQGVNIALRDVVVAANHLLPVLASGTTPDALDAAAARIESERLPEVATIQEIQDRAAAIVLGRQGRLFREIVLFRILPLLSLTGLPGRIAPRLGRPFLYGTTTVQLAV
jgi:2-polyprenyl-6-methoxyphenol hydroxylase-like FAD-dependent oxidoreductase